MTDDTWTYNIQCGRVAMIAPDDTYLCGYHVHVGWECAYGAWLPDGRGGPCSTCQAEESEP